jgi:hypothetical protein
MNDRPSESQPEPVYHLQLEAGEVLVCAQSLRLLIADEAHQPTIRGLAREVLVSLEAAPDERGTVIVALAAQQMKITHTALRVLFDDLTRDEAAEIEVIRGILDKLPDEHTMRAIIIT